MDNAQLNQLADEFGLNAQQKEQLNDLVSDLLLESFLNGQKNMEESLA